MAMTPMEEIAKKELKTVLAKEGYKAYAKILDLFDINLTDDPSVVAYTQIGKGRIVVNRNLRLNQVSMVVRHEILHNFLEHEKRMLKHLANQANLDYDTLADTDFNKLQNQLYSNQVFNIAADYEISNRGYTEADKRTAQNLWLNGQKVSGLVTEVEHPDWITLSVEEMYDKLQKEMTQQEQQMSQQLQNQQDSQDSPGNSNSQPGKGNSQQDSSEDGQEGGGSPQGGSSGTGKKKPLQIGDQGDPDIQAREEAERTKEITKKMAKEMDKGSSKNASDSADDLNDVADEADSLVKDIKDGHVDIEQADDLQDRIDKIRKAFSDAANKAAITAEIDDHINQEKIDKQTREMLSYLNNDMNRFKNSLAAFVKKATAEQKDRTWRRQSRRYTGAPDEILTKGHQWRKSKHIPIINVYFDQSGSWDESDIQEGVKALGVLNNYKDKGEIKLNVKFFANHVHTNASAARAERGTDVREVFEDIKNTSPDNVIIMTDSDGDHDRLPDVVVPGAVWLLFRNDRSNNVINHIHGLAQTQVYDIE